MTHPTKRRTYSREDWEAAQRSWADGRFSAEWKPWRHLAAMEAGIIAAPAGTEWDSWTDDSPSQRAILIRAIRETPALLRSAIRTTRRPTWEAVIEQLIAGRDRWREQQADAERDEAWHRSRRATADEDATALAGIIRRLGERERGQAA